MSWDKYRRQPWHQVASSPPIYDPTFLLATTTTSTTSTPSPLLLRRDTRKLTATPATPITTHTPTPDEDEETMNTSPNFLGITKTPYSFSQMMRSTLFGISVGSLTGAGFGFMETMRTVQENKGLKSLSNKGKASYIMQGVGKHAGLFGAFFGGYHTLKYFGRTYVDPGDYELIGLCSVISLGAIGFKPAIRPILPYSVMLIGMDSFNELFRDKQL